MTENSRFTAAPNSREQDSSILQNFLADHPNINFVRYSWIDYSGIPTARIATKAFALSLVRKNSPMALPSPILNAFGLDSMLDLEVITTGKDELWPDWSSLRVCEYHPSHAVVCCSVYESGINGDGKGFLKDPRWRLQEVCTKAKKEQGLDFLVGVEIEFYILDNSSGTPKVINSIPNSWSTATYNSQCLEILEEIVLAMERAGVPVRQFHSEGGGGSFEISTEPLPPVQAADTLAYCQETIKVIVRKHGFKATMFPQPFEKMSPVGLHHHLSISPADKEESFLAGLLENWRSLSAFYMPNFNSHTRLSGTKKVFWANNNKTAPINRVKKGHWELRPVDGTVNPYLNMTAILTAGLMGMKEQKELQMKEPERYVFEKFEEGEEDKLGITEMMPGSLAEGIQCLKSNKALKEALGADLFDTYVRVKEREEKVFSKLSTEERREVSMRIF